jgi:hypothetical protein
MVGELLLELLVGGSNPSGVELLLDSTVRDWDPTCSIRIYLSIDTGYPHSKQGLHLNLNIKTI